MRFHIELIFILKVVKSCLKRSFDKQNLTLVVIFMKFMKLAKACLINFM